MRIKRTDNPDIKAFRKPIELLNEVFSLFEEDYKEYSAKIAFEMTKNAKDVAIFSVYANNKLIAFAFGYARYKGFYHIWQLGVKKRFRNKGAATRLYDDIESFAKSNKYKGCTLNTTNKYNDNIRLILNRGYKIYDIDRSGEHKKDPKIMFKLLFNM